MTRRVQFLYSDGPDFKEDPVTAIFIDSSTSDRSYFDCYSHLGQHSSASVNWAKTQRPATATEYANLLAELQDRYNDLLVVNPLTPSKGNS